MQAGQSPSADDVEASRTPSVRFIEQFLSQDNAGRLTGLLLGQLDALNRISATFGRHQSEAFCADYARQLRRLLLPSTPIIRLSERRFAALIPLESMTTIIDVASNLAEEHPPQLRVGDDTFLVDVTLGIAVYPTHADDAESLFRRAELALNDARQSELTFEIYRPDSTQQAAALWKFASDLEKAVQAGELEVYMQPKVHITDGRVAGAEALVRWRQQSGRLISPADFIPFAERSGSVVPITWLVFDRIAALADGWSSLPAGFTVAINVSAQVLDHPEFRSRLGGLKAVLDARDIRLTLELTEESLVEGRTEGAGKLERIRKMGVGISIDDFGKGYSSLTYLKEIPATEIKIDKQFIGSVASDSKDLHIVKATIDLAHAFGMQVVAEGVDNDQSLRVLAELGCELAQGFYIARPMRADLLAGWVQKYTRSATVKLLQSNTRAIAAEA
jgi:EAL domain-containing protein (putative c-di-GMP-specific phosphodiesterase class I)/GGDEF domain-containing protein